MTCETIEKEISALIIKRNALQEELHSAVGMGKVPIIAQIKKLNKNISEKKQELAICKEQNPDPKFPLLTTNLLGSYTIIIRNLDENGDRKLEGGFLATVSFDIFRKYITIDWLKELSASFEVEVLGKNTTTVTLRNPSRGTYNRFNRSMFVTLPLFFDHSIDFPVYTEDSSINYSLNTYESIDIANGSPIDQNGNISLVGGGKFVDGYLDEKISHIYITAKFENLP